MPEKIKSRTFIHKCNKILKLKLSSYKEDAVFFFILFFIFIHVIWSLRALVCISPTKCTMCEENVYLKVLAVQVHCNIFKISCYTRLVFVLHLLLNRVILLVIARKAVKSIFILVQFFLYPRKQGWFFTCPWLW